MKSPLARRLASVWCHALVMVALMGSACTHEVGHWSTDAPPASPATDIIALGQIPSGAAGRKLARRLGSALDEQYATGHTPLLLWVGGLAATNHPDRRCRSAPRRGSSAALAEVVARHRGRGGASYAVFGADDWRCPAPAAVGKIADHPQRHYVLRLAASGDVRLASSCDGTPVTCRLVDATPDTQAELVVIDTAWWLMPSSSHANSAANSNDAEEELDALLAAVVSPVPWPKILVLAVPIESAGPRGLGGRRSGASFHHLPPSLQQAISSGVFAGAITGGDEALQFVDDLAPAIRRSARTWIDAPLFQVVATGTTYPKASPRRLLDRFPQRRGLAVAPDLAAEGPGFVQLDLDSHKVHVQLHDRSGYRWRVSTASVPLSRPPHAAEGSAPPMEPCLRCAPRPIDAAKSTAPDAEPNHP